MLLASLCAAAASAQSSGSNTFANPLDLNYKYNFEQLNLGISYRTSADPVIITHKGAYYIFATLVGGWWHSTDLVNWRFVEPRRWPFEDMVAPAARSVRDTLYLLQSTTIPKPIMISLRPENGELEFYNRLFPSPPGAQSQFQQNPATPGAVPPGPWDPDIFHDADTDKWYLYWGSSNFYPLFGIELDKNRRLLYVDTPVALISLHPERHGWERFGRDHRETRTPFIEGAWMTRHAGKYYLQYAAPGTEYNVYANGTYIGDRPLGPFTYAPWLERGSFIFTRRRGDAEPQRTASIRVHGTATNIFFDFQPWHEGAAAARGVLLASHQAADLLTHSSRCDYPQSQTLENKRTSGCPASVLRAY